MSAEPGRKSAYSHYLRWRVVWQRIAMELTFRAIAANLNISLGTVYNVCQLFETTGEVDPKPIPKREELRKLDGHHELYIIGLVMENPALQLSEICSMIEEISPGTQVSLSTVCRLLHHYGITRKKVEKVALQRNEQYRTDFLVDMVVYYRREMLV